MSKSQRIKSFLVGVLAIPTAALLALVPDAGYTLIMAFLSIALIFGGLRLLWYFFTMARFMVGGKRSLYIGVIILDLGLFTASIADIPKIYIMLYLLSIHLFRGAVEILASVNSKTLGAVHWKLKFSQGVINVIVGLACLVFIGAKNVAVYIYCAGMAYNGVMRMITAFRKTAMIYIP